MKHYQELYANMNRKQLNQVHFQEHLFQVFLSLKVIVFLEFHASLQQLPAQTCLYSLDGQGKDLQTHPSVHSYENKIYKEVKGAL